MPTSVRTIDELLMNQIIEIKLDRDSGNLFYADTILLGKDDKSVNTRFEAVVEETATKLYVNGVMFRRLRFFPREETDSLFLQYKQGWSGLNIQRLSAKPARWKKGKPSGKPDVTEEDTIKYLAGCLEERLVKGYMSKGKVVLNSVPYEPNHVFNYHEAGKITEKGRGYVARYAKNYLPKGITALNTLRLKLLPAPKNQKTKQFDTEEMADLYGVSREIMEEIENTGIFKPTRVERMTRAKQIKVYFRAFDMAVEAIYRSRR